jgi:hypothetical protein
MAWGTFRDISASNEEILFLNLKKKIILTLLLYSFILQIHNKNAFLPVFELTADSPSTI